MLRKWFFSMAVLTTMAATFSASAQPRGLPPIPGDKTPLPTGQPLLQPRPDLSADRIDFEVLARYTPYPRPGGVVGRVRVVGVIKNVGLADYVSAPGKQTAVLLENGRVVATQPFQNLARNREVRVTFERDWPIGLNRQPPVYTVEIKFAADIARDGNPQNDDASASNNRRNRSGREIPW